jgi:drug/metabolite transporter (DMT)-like permease
MSVKRQVAIALVLGSVVAVGAWTLYTKSHYSSVVGANITVPGVLAAIPIWDIHGDDTPVFWGFVIVVNVLLYSVAWFVLMRLGFGSDLPKSRR